MSPIFSLVSSVRTSSGLEAGDENAATKALCIAPNDVIPRNIPLQIDSRCCVEVCRRCVECERWKRCWVCGGGRG